jgi:MEMO1 family protein
MDQYINLAEKTIEEYIRNGKVIDLPDDLPSEMLEKRAGVFVTIEKKTELRGCIGTFLPTKENIAEEIISNTVASASRDPRFEPIKTNELADLNISVDILSVPALAKKEYLDPKKYGIMVRTNDGRTGLLLPDLEGVITIDQQINIACQKAHINLINDKFEILKFSVERHGKK